MSEDTFKNVAKTKDLDKGKIIPVSISKEMKKSYLDYAMSVIVSRALPDIRDGLKPVHRRIIYAANSMNITYNARYKKSATIVGEVMGKYHPHGNDPIYGALVRLAQPFASRYPLIDGQGNFGNIDGDSPAAMRYTEARLARISNYLLKDIDKNTVVMSENFSAEHLEPTVLPSVIPNLLMNGSQGIAVGMATNIPPHNLEELANGIIMTLDRSKLVNIVTHQESISIHGVIDEEIDIKNWEVDNTIKLEELVQFIKGPDFPTGCTIYDQSETLRYFATGRGRIIARAKTEIIELKKGKHAIIITEIPYLVNRSTLIEKIANLVKNKKVDGISEIRNESSKGETRIVIELKKDSNPQKILNYLYKHTQLQDAFNVNMLALIDGQPQLIGIKTFINEFIKHRRTIIKNRTIFLLTKAKEREHILDGLKKALNVIDEVIELIKKSKDTEIAKRRLMEKFEFTEIQTIAILDMQLRRLAALEREKIESELKDIKKKIKEYHKLLTDPSEMINVIKDELKEAVDKFGDERRTKVIKSKVGELSDEDLIENEQTLITMTESGYIKRTKPTTYKSQVRGGKGIAGMKTKNEDIVTLLRLTNTHDNILFFTNLGKVYLKTVWEIPEASRKSKGTSVINLIEIDSTEKVVGVITLTQKDIKSTDHYITIATQNGQIKKTPLDQFENIRKSGIYAIGLKNNDKIVNIQLSTGNNDILLITTQGKSIRFKESNVRPMGRTAYGVRGIKLKKNDTVVTMEVLDSKNINDDDYKIMTITENGYGKTTVVKDYPVQTRGGSGVIAAKVTKKTGVIIEARAITENSKDVLLTSDSGQIIRISSSTLPTSQRATQGVILMRLKAKDKVSAVSIFHKLEDENK